MLVIRESSIWALLTAACIAAAWGVAGLGFGFPKIGTVLLLIAFGLLCAAAAIWALSERAQP